MIPAPRPFPANSLALVIGTCPRTPIRASIKTRRGPWGSGRGKRCFRLCFPDVLPPVLPEKAAKTGACTTPKTVKRHIVQYKPVMRARARVRMGMFYRFTVLDIYQDIEIIGFHPKTQGKTPPGNPETGVLPPVSDHANALKTRKKGGL